MEIILCMLFIHGIFPKSYDFTSGQGKWEPGACQGWNCQRLSVPTSHPTVGHLPVTKKHCLCFLPFYTPVSALVCISQEALGKCGGGTVGSLQPHSVHGSHPVRTESCFLAGAFAGLGTQSPAQWSNEVTRDATRVGENAVSTSQSCWSSAPHQSSLQHCHWSFLITWFSFKLM